MLRARAWEEQGNLKAKKVFAGGGLHSSTFQLSLTCI
jgi:hypothetical protein